MQPVTGRASSSSHRRLIAAGACALVIGLVWMGCSVEKHYKTLSIFFDGVPDPEAKAQAAAAGGVTAAMRLSATYTIHKPYAEEKCAECHKGRIVIAGRDSTMCAKCHEAEETKYPRMHGPVAAGACLWCHSPHESGEAHLLRDQARNVCTQCHDQSLISNDEIPAHSDTARSCLECHHGHGGTAAMFLKEGVSRLAPAPGGTSAPTEPR